MPSECKPGMKVKIVKHSTGNNYKYSNDIGFENVWIDQMDKFIGQTREITYVSKKGVCFASNEDDSGDTIWKFAFPPKALVNA